MTEARIERLPGLEKIDHPPTFFFTMGDGTNPKSEEVIAGLQRKFSDGPVVFCKTLADEAELVEYMKAAKLRPMYAVAIFDGFCKGRYMISMPRSDRRWERFVKRWSPAFWNVMVCPAMSSKRTDGIVHQIWVLYHEQYLERLDRRQFPAGEPLSPNSREHRKSKRRQRFEQRLQSRQDHLLGLAGINA